MERISLQQLFTLTVFFQIGTTIIFGFGASTGKDAWIATIISIILGMVGIGLYLILSYLNPGLTLVEWFPAQFGKWIGTPIAWLYPLLFLYEMGRGLNDLKYLSTSLILVGTPYWAVIVLFLIAVVFLQFCGIEVIGRVGEIFLPYFLLMIFIILLLLLVGDIIKTENLQPVLSKGWQPIWKASFPLGASQGFAQTIQFGMIWTLVHSSHKEIVKTTLFAGIFSGSIILITDLVLIMGLGEYFFELEVFPMFSLVSKLDVGEVIKNLNIFAALLFIISAIFKISLHMFFAIRGIQLLTKMKKIRILIIIIFILAIYLGHSLSNNIQEHLQVAFDVFPYNLWLVLLWVLPVLLLVVTVMRRALSKTNNSSKV